MTSNTNAEGILQYAVDQLVIARDELRAEIEQLQADNARLLGRIEAAQNGWEKCQADRDKLLEENERLRAALEKIEAGYEQRLSAAELASMARQAL